MTGIALSATKLERFLSALNAGACFTLPVPKVVMWETINTAAISAR